LVEAHPEPAKKRTRVLLADDHAILLEAFRRLLEPECAVVGTATDGLELLRLAKELVPDIVVVDVSMPHLTGLDAARQLHAQLPDVKVIFLTVNEDPDLAASALREGASGFVLKTAAARDLFEAIRTALAGGTYITPSIASTVQEALRQPTHRVGIDKLSARQREILALVALGKTMKEIASQLDITPRTVAFHKYRMMELLGMGSTAELIQFAMRHGLAGA
jgi:DNA-binding NarL/FixJ family response regulator